MKVSTRIISGFGILMILALSALTCQVWFIHRMQAINDELSAINFRAASILLHIDRDAEAVQEFSRKYFVAPASYSGSLNEARSEFDTELADLQRVIGSQDAANDVRLLAESWNAYKIEMDRQQNLITEGSSDNILPPELDAKIALVRSRTISAYDTVQKTIVSQVDRAKETGGTAEQLSWLAGVMVVLLGVPVTILIIRAIADPLRQLTRGTRTIAKGQFWHRLPTDGHDEFTELARDFNAMSERLGELDQMKKDFVSHVSHELKAPLASIRQTAHLLLEQVPGPLNDQQRKLLRLSSNSGERLAAMVGNLLDVSRLEAGTMEYEIGRCDLVALAKNVAEEFEVQASEKGVGIQVESDEPTILVECDRDRIVQVIGNLIDNALKFSSRESQMTVRISRCGTAANPLVLFAVTDRGPGVPAGHKERVFRKFHQVKQGKKISGQGVGLGLAICKSIVDAHRGRIWVEDNPSGGSVFCVELHAATRAEEASEHEVSTTA